MQPSHTRMLEPVRSSAIETTEPMARFYQQYRRFVLSVANKIVNDPWEAEDIVQTVMLIAWIRAPWVCTADRPTRWLKVVAENAAIGVLRRRYREVDATRKSSAGRERDAASALDVVLQRAQTHRLYTMLCTLRTERCRLLMLAYFSGMTHAEIAQALHCPVGTVKSQIRRTLLRLRKIM